MVKHLRAGLVSLGFLFIVGGVTVIGTKTLVILPILRWIRSLSEPQIDLYVSVWGHFLVATGIVIFLIASILFWLRKKKRDL